MAAYNQIRIKFEVDGRQYEAVGFLVEGETSVVGDEMFRRVPNAIGKEDEELLREHLDQLPVELQRYYLVTNRPCLGFPQGVSYFGCSGSRWYWGFLDSQWYDYYLVVRRCA